MDFNQQNNTLINILFQKGLVGVLFVIIIANSFLSLLYSEINRYQIKSLVKEKLLQNIPEKELTKIIKEENFSANEFEYNGKLYDVVKQIKAENKTILYCLEDSQETLLKQKIERILAENFSLPLNKNKQKILSFLKIVYLPSEINSFRFYSFTTKVVFSNLVATTLFPFQFLLIPPPK